MLDSGDGPACLLCGHEPPHDAPQSTDGELHLLAIEAVMAAPPAGFQTHVATVPLWPAEDTWRDYPRRRRNRRRGTAGAAHIDEPEPEPEPQPEPGSAPCGRPPHMGPCPKCSEEEGPGVPPRRRVGSPSGPKPHARDAICALAADGVPYQEILAEGERRKANGERGWSRLTVRQILGPARLWESPAGPL